MTTSRQNSPIIQPGLFIFALMLMLGLASCGPDRTATAGDQATGEVITLRIPSSNDNDGIEHAAAEGVGSTTGAKAADPAGGENGVSRTDTGNADSNSNPDSNTPNGDSDRDGNSDPDSDEGPAIAAPADPGSAPGDGPEDLGAPQVPGEPIDFGPGLGTPLQIVGVAHDDVLNFRVAPSPNADIVSAFPPLHPDLDMYALGEAWSAPSGVWWKVSVGGDEVWANQSFLGMPADERNVFDTAAQHLQILKFETTEDAALGVAEAFASTDPASRVEFAAPALNFDTGDGFAVVDVLDLGDDAQKGWRLRVEVDVVFDESSGEPGAQDVAFVVLTAVDGQPICGRGAQGQFCL